MHLQVLWSWKMVMCMWCSASSHWPRNIQPLTNASWPPTLHKAHTSFWNCWYEHNICSEAHMSNNNDRMPINALSIAFLVLNSTLKSPKHSQTQSCSGVVSRLQWGWWWDKQAPQAASVPQTDLGICWFTTPRRSYHCSSTVILLVLQLLYSTSATTTPSRSYSWAVTRTTGV